MYDIYLKIKFKNEVTREQLKDIVACSVGALFIDRGIISYARYYRNAGNIYFVFRTDIKDKTAQNISSIKIQHYLSHPKIISSTITWIRKITTDPRVKFIIE